LAGGEADVVEQVERRRWKQGWGRMREPQGTGPVESEALHAAPCALGDAGGLCGLR
jgi:hypothetical protein